MHLAVNFLKGGMARCGFIDSWAVVSGLVGWLGMFLGRNLIGKLMTRKFGEEVCRQTSLNGQNTWRYLFPVWLFTKGWPREKRILKSSDRKILSVDTSHPLSPAKPILAQWTHEQSSHRGKGKSYAWATWTLIHQGWPSYSHCWLTSHPVTKTSSDNLICHHSPGWYASCLMANWFH